MDPRMGSMVKIKNHYKVLVDLELLSPVAG